MSTNYQSTPRATAAGVTTASILVVILAMGVSTLMAPEPQVTTGEPHAHVAQATPAHKS